MNDRDIKQSFYNTPAWKACRESYAKSKGYLCENCMSKGIYSAGEVVHHKIHITKNNVNNPAITLNFDNLELLCRTCHGDVHSGHNTRYKIDDLGRVITTGR